MQKIFSLAVAFLLSFSIFAQDFLSVPRSNPALHPEAGKSKLDKSFFQLDSLVYQFDTLQLPFIDDFTEDHFPELITDPLNDPRVTDTTVYAIFELNNDVYQGNGFFSDSTYTYSIDTTSLSGDTVNITLNPATNILFYQINRFPPVLSLETVFPPYSIFDTVTGGSDTNFITPNIIQDSVRYYVVEKDTNAFYANRFVHINNTLGFFPPSIGVASFDGLDERGLPYNFDDITSSGLADFLTSNPIDLSGTSDSTFFSFFYQAKGFALDGPELEDSLSLEFYNPNNGDWGLVWQIEGISPTSAADSFRQAIIRVDSQFRTSGFQFRFRNRARLTGAFDHWHVDYLYLDDNRSAGDTSYKDLAYVYPSSGTLDEYSAMPVWHFKTNPASYMADSVFYVVRNNFQDPLNVFNKVVFPDTTNPPANYFTTPPSQFLPIQSYGSISRGYPIGFSYPMGDIDSTQVFKGILDIDFRPAPIETKDFIRANDTIFSNAVLKNYYAYDDGSAEAAYGINAGSQGGNKSYLAVRFDMPFQDTIGGVQMYFLPQNNDIRNQNFKLTIWNSLNPPNIIFQKEVSDNALYGERDGYVTYWFDSLVLAGPTFFVGFEKVGPLSMSLGYDFNRNHRDKISWSLDGNNWFFPSNNIIDGSVMIRPILRKKGFGVGLKEELLAKKKAHKLRVYPNPANEEFFISEIPQGIQKLELYAIDGRVVRVYSAFQNRFSLEGLESGLFFLKAQNDQGEVWTTKIICRKP